MDYFAWSVDVSTGCAVHESGFKLEVEGNPVNPSGVNPARFPDNLTAVQQATLLRCGLEALMKAAQSKVNEATRSRFSAKQQAETPKVDRKTPKRPVLSLKR